MVNIILIGMPNSGKTTIGNRLAKETNKKFIDTDKLILDKTNLSPREIVEKYGETKFLKLQEDILCNIKEDNFVLSTGGSVIYSKKIMDYLKTIGVIIYLNNSFEKLLDRMTTGRKIIGSSKKDFKSLYDERIAYYKKYCDIEIFCDNKSIEEILQKIKMEVLK